MSLARRVAVLAVMALGAAGCSGGAQDEAPRTGTEREKTEREETEDPADFDPAAFEGHTEEMLIGLSLDEFTVDELDIHDMAPCDLAHPDDAAAMRYIGVSNLNQCRWNLDDMEVTMGASDQIPGLTAPGYVLQLAVRQAETQHDEYMMSIGGYPAYQLVASSDGLVQWVCRTHVAVADDLVLNVNVVTQNGECKEVNESLTTSAVEHLAGTA
jgi:hypothetical protein